MYIELWQCIAGNIDPPFKSSSSSSICIGGKCILIVGIIFEIYKKFLGLGVGIAIGTVATSLMFLGAILIILKCRQKKGI